MDLNTFLSGRWRGFWTKWKIFIFFCQIQLIGSLPACSVDGSPLFVEVWGFISEFCFGFGPEPGPEVSSCPAVLGDDDPYWGVSECVMFTLFALMYITMSKYSKFILNKYREKSWLKKNLISVLLMICLSFYYSIKRSLWGICPLFVCLLEPCSNPSMTLPRSQPWMGCGFKKLFSVRFWFKPDIRQ